MSSSHRNQSVDLQPNFSSVWCIFCREALLSRLKMSYIVLIRCLFELLTLFLVYLHVSDYFSSHCYRCPKAFLLINKKVKLFK